MKLNLRICYLILIVTAVFWQAGFSAVVHSKPSNSDDMKVKTLENGLNVIAKESHSSPVVSFHMWVKTGSSNENGKTRGMSHLLEHMLFKGTDKRQVGEIAKEIDNAGGMINAFTSKDVTVYYLTIASRFFDSGLDIISDAIMNSSIDEKELEKEKKVVLEEIRMGEDDPERSSYKDLFLTAYDVHQYRFPVIGYTETVSAVTRDTLLGYYKERYVPANMTLVIAGDIHSEEVFSKVAEVFENFKNIVVNDSDYSEEPPQKGFKFEVTKKSVKQVFVKMAFHIPGISSEDVAAIDLLASIMGEGNSSRLYKKLKLESQTANSVYAYSMTPKEPGLFIVSLSVDTDKLDQALEIALNEIKALIREKAGEEELERAKLSIESSTIYSSETVNGIAQNIGSNITLTGDIDFEEKYLNRVKGTTAEDIKRVAEEYIKDSNMTVYMIIPTDLERKLDRQWFTEILTKSGQFAEDEIEVEKPSDEIKKDVSSSGKVIKKTLPSGAILLLEEDHEIPIVALQATFKGGLAQESKGDEGAMNFAFDMLPLGAAGMPSVEIAENIDNIAGNLSTFSGRDLSGISMNFLSQYISEGLGLFFNIMKHPDFNNDDIEIKRNEILSKIKNTEDELTHFVFKLFTKELFNEYPYQNDIFGDSDAIKKLSRSDLRNYYEQTAVPDKLILSVAGDFDSEKLTKEIERELQNWRTNKRSKTPETGFPSPLSGIKKKVYFKDRQQAHIIIGFRASTVLDKDSYPMEILDAILSGQGGKLFIELRDKQSLAYSVTSFFRPLGKSGIFGVYIATNPENRDKAVNGIIEELNKVLSGDISDQDIERAKKSLIGHFEIGLQKRSSRASITGTDEALGLGYDNYLVYSNNILAVTKEDILKAAKKYIDLDNYVLTIIEPEKVNSKSDSGKTGD